MKRKDPQQSVTDQPNFIHNDDSHDEDDVVADLLISNDKNEEQLDGIDLSAQLNEEANEIFIDLTESISNRNNEERITEHEPIEVNDVIISKDLRNEQSPHEISLGCELYAIEEFIPDRVIWESILGSLERCDSDAELFQTAMELQRTLKPLIPRKENVYLPPNVDKLDHIAANSLPRDLQQDVVPIAIQGDGNCMCRSFSHSYSGSDLMHLELRTRIVIDSILNKKHYLSHNFLCKGASSTREDLAHLYAKFSDHYVNGQRITENTVEYIYSLEMHDCAKVNSYMGLWQIAQAANVLKIPIQSVYPEGGDTLMRQDFNRFFFPVDHSSESCSNMIMIMWTSVLPNGVPSHFVPLLTRTNK